MISLFQKNDIKTERINALPSCSEKLGCFNLTLYYKRSDFAEKRTLQRPNGLRRLHALRADEGPRSVHRQAPGGLRERGGLPAKAGLLRRQQA